MNAHWSHIFALEWLDGSWKTTQALLLAKKITWIGKDVCISHWKWGEFFSDHFSNIDTQKKESISPLSHLMLQVADLMYRIEKEVIPAIREDKIVILDRSLQTIIARWVQLWLVADEIDDLLLWWTDLDPYKDALKDITTIYLQSSTDTTIERILERSKIATPSHREYTEGTLLNMHLIESWWYDPYSWELLSSQKRVDMMKSIQGMHKEIYDTSMSEDTICIDADKHTHSVHKVIWKEVKDALGI